MKRLLLIIFACTFLLSCQKDRQRHVIIGVLNHASVAEDSIRGFKDFMSENGYIESEDITYLYKGPVAQKNLEIEARSLVDQGIDILLSITMPATVAAVKAGVDKDVPVLFAPNSNPVDAGLVQSMEHPGGNITGVSFWIQEDKRLEWLKRIVPGAKRILVPYMEWDKSPRIDIENIEGSARKLGIEIVQRPINDSLNIENAAQDIPEGIDAVFIPADALIESNAPPVFVKYAMQRNIPVSSPQSFGFSSGALFAYGFVQYDTGRQGARMALLILDGANPGELPVEMAETKLMINLKTAKELGMEIPAEIISKADMIIR